MKGYIQVYTGNGKGKTTSALGLALRAYGAGLKVFIAQFIKGGQYSEIKALKALADRVTIEQFGLGRFIRGLPAPEDVQAARQGLARVTAVLSAGDFDVVILDEANGALKCGLFAEADLLAIMAAKPEGVELIITGRDATDAVMAKADLVTEMKAVKHYFDQGVPARVGIEK